MTAEERKEMALHIGQYSLEQKRLMGEYASNAANFARWMDKHHNMVTPTRATTEKFMAQERLAAEGMRGSMEQLDVMVRELAAEVGNGGTATDRSGD